MGLRAALFSECATVRSFASTLGFAVFQLEELIKITDNCEVKRESSDDSIVASEVLRRLGFSGGDVLDKCEYDLIILHIMGTKMPKVQKEKMIISADVDWLNKLAGSIMQAAQPGSSIASTLHFSIVLSYGTSYEDVNDCSLTSNSSRETNSDLYLLRPRQSYTMKGGKILNDIR